VMLRESTPMQRSTLLISTMFLLTALDCGGRENGTSAVASAGRSSGTSGDGSAEEVPESGNSGASGDGVCAVVQSSVYDQSCMVDSDCALVGGNVTGCQCCPYGAINVMQRPKYEANLSAELALFDGGFATCTCGPIPPPPSPCCIKGICQVGGACAGATIAPDIDASGDDANALANGDAATDANVCSQPPPGCARLVNASPCQAGYICDPTQGSTPSECFACDPKNGWLCSADTGGGLCVQAADAGGSGATCPSVEPRAGDLCNGPIACSYTGPCGPVLLACKAGKSYWGVLGSATCSGACPASEPKQGAPCMAGGKCSYKSACGSEDTVFCDGTGTAMRIDYGTCPTCPAQEPAPLTVCSGSLSCMYTNPCAGTDVANCMGSMWAVLRGDCEK
jgi:hypothetical protein